MHLCKMACREASTLSLHGRLACLPAVMPAVQQVFLFCRSSGMRKSCYSCLKSCLAALSQLEVILIVVHCCIGFTNDFFCSSGCSNLGFSHV